MFEYIARLFVWLRHLLAPRTRRPGRHSRAYLAAPQASTPQRPPLPPHIQARNRPLEPDDVLFVRPYVLSHEQRRERRRQMERRTALALATMGIDYAGANL